MTTLTPTSSFWDAKKICAFTGAGIATLLGLPWLLDLMDPYLVTLVTKLYPESAALVYYLIKGGIFVTFFTLMQSVLYLAITSAVASIAAHTFRLAM
ncbi:MAG: hypothetical protein RIM72_11240 [Alphaproteobacteria bacterium]